MSSFEHSEPSAGSGISDREQSLVELVRLDYDATLRTLAGLVTTGGQIRTIGIAAWGVVLGLAVNAKSVALAGLTLVLLLAFVYGDAYHSALYRRALGRAIRLETLLDSWVDRLGIDADDPDAVVRTRAKLEMHRFGVQRSLRRPSWRDLVAARPRPIFWAIYPALLVASLAAVVSFA